MDAEFPASSTLSYLSIRKGSIPSNLVSIRWANKSSPCLIRIKISELSDDDPFGEAAHSPPPPQKLYTFKVFKKLHTLVLVVITPGCCFNTLLQLTCYNFFWQPKSLLLSPQQDESGAKIFMSKTTSLYANQRLAEIRECVTEYTFVFILYKRKKKGRLKPGTQICNCLFLSPIKKLILKATPLLPKIASQILKRKKTTKWDALVFSLKMVWRYWKATRGKGR